MLAGHRRLPYAAVRAAAWLVTLTFSLTTIAWASPHPAADTLRQVGLEETGDGRDGRPSPRMELAMAMGVPADVAARGNRGYLIGTPRAAGMEEDKVEEFQRGDFVVYNGKLARVDDASRKFGLIPITTIDGARVSVAPALLSPVRTQEERDRWYHGVPVPSLRKLYLGCLKKSARMFLTDAERRVIERFLLQVRAEHRAVNQVPLLFSDDADAWANYYRKYGQKPIDERNGQPLTQVNFVTALLNRVRDRAARFAAGERAPAVLPADPLRIIARVLSGTYAAKAVQERDLSLFFTEVADLDPDAARFLHWQRTLEAEVSKVDSGGFEDSVRLERAIGILRETLTAHRVGHRPDPKVVRDQWHRATVRVVQGLIQRLGAGATIDGSDLLFVKIYGLEKERVGLTTLGALEDFLRRNVDRALSSVRYGQPGSRLLGKPPVLALYISGSRKVRPSLAWRLAGQVGKLADAVINRSFPLERDQLQAYAHVDVLGNGTDLLPTAGMEEIQSYVSVGAFLEAVPLPADQQAIAREAQAAGATQVVVVEVPPAQGPATIRLYTPPDWVKPVDAQVRNWRVGAGPDAMIFMAEPYAAGQAVEAPAVVLRPVEAPVVPGVPNITLTSLEEISRLTPQGVYAMAVNVRLAGQSIPAVAVMIAYTDKAGRDYLAMLL